MLARTLPDASLLTPQATIPTVLVPVMREQAPTTAVPGLAIPDEGAETTIRPRPVASRTTPSGSRAHQPSSRAGQQGHAP
jgi:hypothetical protein